jgi:signal transduction histidine kinase/CheY-like chemotaxis protein
MWLSGKLWQSSEGMSPHRKRHMEIHLIETQFQGKKALVVVFSKIPEELVELRAQYKDHLIASISHELQTPLNCMIGLLDEALADEHLATDLKLKYLKPINCSTKLLQHFVRDLVDFSEIKSRKIEIETVHFNLREKCGEIIEFFQQQAQIKGIEISYAVEEGVPAFVVTDPERLTQILVNLMSNAMKFTSNGNVKLLVELENPSTLRFKVVDTGLGMKKDEKKILESILAKPDELHYVSSIRNSKGVCLGLTITQSLVKLLDSPGIQIESDPGIGSSFSFTLECLTLQPHEISVNSDEPERPGDITPIDVIQDDLLRRSWVPRRTNVPNSNGLETRPVLSNPPSFAILQFPCECKRVMIVDDNEFNVFTLKTKLTNRGYEVIEAFSARQAINKLNALFAEKSIEVCKSKECRKLKMIFMDVDMPETNGLEATQLVNEMIARKEIPDIPVVGCSAFTKADDIRAAIKAGMKDYVCKPVKDHDLEDVLKKF